MFSQTNTNVQSASEVASQIQFMESTVTEQIKSAIFSSTQQLAKSTSLEIDVPKGCFMDAGLFDLSTASPEMRSMPRYAALMRTLAQSRTQISARYHQGSRKLKIQINWDLPSIN